MNPNAVNTSTRRVPAARVIAAVGDFRAVHLTNSRDGQEIIIERSERDAMGGVSWRQIGDPLGAGGVPPRDAGIFAMMLAMFEYIIKNAEEKS